MSPILLCWKYFPNNKGLVSGSIVAGFGVSAFFLNFVATHIVNPLDLQPTIIIGNEKYYDNRVTDNVNFFSSINFLLIFIGSKNVYMSFSNFIWDYNYFQYITYSSTNRVSYSYFTILE